MSPLNVPGPLCLPLGLAGEALNINQYPLFDSLGSGVPAVRQGEDIFSPGGTSCNANIPMCDPLPPAVRLSGVCPAVPPPKPVMSELFGEIADHPDIEQVSHFLESSVAERLRMSPPSLSRLRKVRDRLAARSFEEPCKTSARDEYVLALTDLQTLPARESLLDRLNALLPLSNEALNVLWSLSHDALAGLYAAASELSKNRPNLVSFLTNRMIDAFPEITIDAILETVALMADRKVKGFAGVFVPREIKGGRKKDEKFLAISYENRQRIPSLLAECREVLRIADHGAVTRIAHDYSFPMDWSALTRTEEDYVRKRIEARIRFPFREQRDASVDIYFRLANGRHRIAEVKRAYQSLDFPEGAFEKEMLQVFRHALLARIHGLEGVEYLFCAPRIAPRVVSRVREILDLTGTNYVLTLRRSQESEPWDVIERGMKRLGGAMPIPTERRYPFVY